ncbi:MAG: hypothetical protein ACK5LZ_03635 [Anaerorhabdus sp.]
MAIALLFILGLAGFYAVAYYLNHKTPVPEGCENLKAECDGCHISSCGNHPTHQESKGEE